jgi:hypothetical protein
MGADPNVVNNTSRYAHPGPPFIKNRSDGRFCIATPIYDANNNKGKAKYVHFVLNDVSPRAHLTIGKGHPVFAVKLRSFDDLHRTFKMPVRKSSTLALASDTRNKSKYSPRVPSPLPDKRWMHLPIVLSKPERTAPSIHFYFAKPFGMWATTRQWATCETTFTANCKRGDDRLRQTRPARVLHLPTSPPSWNASTIRPCVTCIANHSFKTEETTTTTTSEVAVFTP